MKNLLTTAQTLETIDQMARAIWQKAGATADNLALVGIRTRGAVLALRLQASIKRQFKAEVLLGTLDITLYRDDLSKLAEHPVMKKTEISFSIDAKTVYLVDDVLYTGRTIRCALDALFDFGRPGRIGLAVLVERGGRELPIEADVVGAHAETKVGDNVKVKLVETDGVDQVDVLTR